MKAGNSATAPPNSTENMSSASAPSRTWWPNTKRRPSPMLLNTGARSVGDRRFGDAQGDDRERRGDRERRPRPA